MENKITASNVNLHYGQKQALFDVNIDFKEKSVTALIGPSGCGKSSFLRCLNRMNDTILNCKIAGEILLDGKNIYHDDLDLVLLRARVGMVFQKPNPFPKTIYENVAYGPKIHGLFQKKSELDNIVEESLTKAGLWNEIKDRLHDQASALSGGQQQRLCIARTIAIEPEIILMDEPCSALDPGSTLKIEETISELSSSMTIIIVTHNMQQAARVSDYTGFFLSDGGPGELVEVGPTSEIFSRPKDVRTENYVTGRFG